MSNSPPGLERLREVAILVEVTNLPCRRDGNAMRVGVRHDRCARRLALKLIEPVNGIQDRMGEHAIHLHRSM